jgi:hypothetical protein
MINLIVYYPLQTHQGVFACAPTSFIIMYTHGSSSYIEEVTGSQPDEWVTLNDFYRSTLKCKKQDASLKKARV